MIKGKSISELAAELDRQSAVRADYVADTRQILMQPDISLEIEGHGEAFDVLPTAHRQIGARLGIPAKYYDLMKTQAPDLLSRNVNHWLHANPERRMIRTLDGNARAFLSDRYHRIDNDAIARAVLPVLMGEDIKIESSEITESRMYIQARFPRMEREVKRGDPVQAGLVISNSEIGLGSFQVSPLVYRLVCLNGMITSHALRKYHVGRQAEAIEGSYEVFSDETLKADDDALLLKVRDVVQASLDAAAFESQVIRLQEAGVGPQIEAPIAAVQVLQKTHGLTDAERDMTLTNLLTSGDLSRYGVIQAVTAVANNHDSYDRAVELEHLGGRLLELPARDWQRVVEAA